MSGATAKSFDVQHWRFVHVLSSLRIPFTGLSIELVRRLPRPAGHVLDLPELSPAYYEAGVRAVSAAAPDRAQRGTGPSCR